MQSIIQSIIQSSIQSITQSIESTQPIHQSINKSINEFIEIGGLEYLDSQTSISLIEWPDLISDIDIKNMINIKFEYLSENERLITVLS